MAANPQVRQMISSLPTMHDLNQEDALQDVCLRLCSRDADCAALESPGNFVRRATLNACRDRWKLKQRLRRFQHDYWMKCERPGTRLPVRSAMLKETSQILKKAVATLPPLYRETI